VKQGLLIVADTHDLSALELLGHCGLGEPRLGWMNEVLGSRQLFALLDEPVGNRDWNFGSVANVFLDRAEPELDWPDGFFLWPRNGGLHFGLRLRDFDGLLGNGRGLGWHAVDNDFGNRRGMGGRAVGDDLESRRGLR
jgi:hypothetical protein